MRRQLMGILLTAAVITGGAVQVQAAEQTGSIQVILDHGAESAREAEMTLYYVGEAAEDGYRITEAFGDGFIKQSDAQSPDLAQWLSENAAGRGQVQNLDETGRTVFADLKEGLYLLVQSKTVEGYLPVSPFLIPLPWSGLWELTALPKMQAIVTEPPQTGQHPAPIIGAMGIVLAGMGLAACLDKIRKNR